METHLCAAICPLFVQQGRKKSQLTTNQLPAVEDPFKMGCSNSKSVSTCDDKRPKSDSSLSKGDKVPKSVAFEVKLDDQPEEKAAATNDKPQLPKRLQERLEEPSHTSHTAEEIEEKIQKAAERRLQVMEDRLSKARQSISLPQGRSESTAQVDSEEQQQEQHQPSSKDS